MEQKEVCTVSSVVFLLTFGGLVSEQSLQKKSLSAMVDRIPLWA